MPAEFKRWWFWDYLFDNCRWYRRQCGGHWESWFNDVTHSSMWYQTGQCSLGTDYRPACCFGTPTCEDYP